MGMLMFHVLTQDVPGSKDLTTIDREDWIDEVVRIFPDGLKIDTQ
jgi:hypothetical protein